LPRGPLGSEPGLVAAEADRLLGGTALVKVGDLETVVAVPFDVLARGDFLQGSV